MGCGHSKKKSKGRKGEKRQKDVSQKDEGGQSSSGPTDVCLEKQVERFEWQLRILKQVLSANGNPERAELLKEHADEEVCALVLSIFDKVKTETTADLNVLHEQKSKSVSEENEALLEELQTKHQQEKNQLTQTFVASENILKDKVRDLSSELQVYNNLKRRVTESNFNRDLQRNIQQMNSALIGADVRAETLSDVVRDVVVKPPAAAGRGGLNESVYVETLQMLLVGTQT
ncbi:coiled-coil domain-containing protein 69 [Gouania willdenowi]|uniref:coiled-coil domain-containing protein 69 n=1 Tax=Gouania willdenowi TaxID=441366 RepID=UPI001055E0F7|nr:coiled-coil domain-containing protein 69-like [Gouania willdenowi]